MLVTQSRILILGMKGIFFCRGRKITKFDFFMFKDSLLAFSQSLTLPSLRLFADDTNIFDSSCKATDLEILVNHELVKVKEWWVVCPK